MAEKYLICLLLIVFFIHYSNITHLEGLQMNTWGLGGYHCNLRAKRVVVLMSFSVFLCGFLHTKTSSSGQSVQRCERKK